MIDKRKTDTLGLSVNNDLSPVEVHFEGELDPVVKSELEYLYGGDLKLTSGGLSSENAFIKGTDEAKIINTEINQFVTDEEFKNSAKIALEASDETDTPVVKLFNNLISVAISRQASDIHIDVNGKSLGIKMRFDGILVSYADLDIRVAPMLIARIKLLSGMDITERRKPQDGRFSVIHRSKEVDIRAACMPVTGGERVALRIFNQDPNIFTLEKIGLSETHVDVLTNVISKQSGLLIICGPTGSGKTTTIYSLLSKLKGRGLNIMTIEDPVEMDLTDVVQTQVDEDVDFNFATGLKSLLRNDPDVVLIGEIRDEETANIAVRAAMTGHLVITTVHANSPVGGIKRILNLKVDPTLLSDCLLAVFNQRLIRIYCEECVDTSKLSDGHKAPLPHIFEGCEKCFGTGFSQRRPVMSHFLMTSEDKKMLEENPTKLLDSDTMIDEANAMHETGLTPYFEVNKLKMN